MHFVVGHTISHEALFDSEDSLKLGIPGVLSSSVANMVARPWSVAVKGSHFANECVVTAKGWLASGHRVLSVCLIVCRKQRRRRRRERVYRERHHGGPSGEAP